jgi:hypothetical protein
VAFLISALAWRRMRASMSRSSQQLSAFAAPTTAAVARTVRVARAGAMSPGASARPPALVTTTSPERRGLARRRRSLAEFRGEVRALAGAEAIVTEVPVVCGRSRRVGN